MSEGKHDIVSKSIKIHTFPLFSRKREFRMKEKKKDKGF